MKCRNVHKRKGDKWNTCKRNCMKKKCRKAENQETDAMIHTKLRK